MLLRRAKSESDSRTGLAGFHESAQANPTEVILILSVGFSDFFASVTKFVTSCLAIHSIRWDSPEFESDICEVLGFTEQFFTMSANIWVLYIAVYLYRLIVKKRDSMKYVTAFQLSAWGISFVTAIIPLFENMFGSVGPWCWLMVPSAQWILFYLPVVFIFFAILIIYVCIFVYVRTHKVGTMSSRMRRRQKTAYFRLLFFPLAFLITWMGGLIWRAEHIISDRKQYRWSFFLLTSISLPSQGWLNAIAWYWFNKSKINHMYSVMLCRSSSSENSKSEPLLIDVVASEEQRGVSLTESPAESTIISKHNRRTTIEELERSIRSEKSPYTPMSDDSKDDSQNCDSRKRGDGTFDGSSGANYLPPAFQAAMQFEREDSHDGDEA